MCNVKNIHSTESFLEIAKMLWSHFVIITLVSVVNKDEDKKSYFVGVSKFPLTFRSKFLTDNGFLY